MEERQEYQLLATSSSTHQICSIISRLLNCIQHTSILLSTRIPSPRRIGNPAAVELHVKDTHFDSFLRRELSAEAV